MAITDVLVANLTLIHSFPINTQVTTPFECLKTAQLEGSVSQRYGKTELVLEGQVNDQHNLDLQFVSESGFESQQHYITRYLFSKAFLNSDSSVHLI